VTNDYDVIIVGGGLAGSTLAGSLAGNGARVLVLERERAFRDRVRGELVQPWGAVEARSLGIYDLLKQTCGYEVRWRLSQIYGAPPAEPRDLIATTPHRAGSLHFPHPDMQEVLLDACVRAGATVQRGVRVVKVVPGSKPAVYVDPDQGGPFYARLVVGADGRTSSCRKWGRFPVQRDPEGMQIAGVVVTGVATPEDAVRIFINPARGEVALLIPLGGGRFRSYAGYYPEERRSRLSGPEALSDFLEACVSAGVPPEALSTVQAAGPLASFDCTENWVPHPYQAGVVLVGDAAAVSNPVFGCGLSLALRDVRVLSSLLTSEPDWNKAADAYAEEHDRYFGTLHRLLGWMIQLFYERGQQAADLRKRAFARLAEDPARAPDFAGLGPDCPSDQAAYYNLFGEA